MKFIGDIRPASEFRLTAKVTSMAASTFIAPDGDTIRVTRRAADLFDLPDATEVLAHWHGRRLTEPFRLTVGTLKRLGGWDDGAAAKPLPPQPLRPLTGRALERRRRLLGLPA
jgi:hypothetical protein